MAHRRTKKDIGWLWWWWRWWWWMYSIHANIVNKRNCRYVTLTRLYLIFPNFDSSISTVIGFPFLSKPPSGEAFVIAAVAQISRRKQYKSTTVREASGNSRRSCACVIPTLQKYILFKASASVMLEPWNQLPVFMDKRTLLLRRPENRNENALYILYSE